MTAEEFLDAPDAPPAEGLPDWRNVGQPAPMSAEEFLDAPDLPPGFESRMVGAGLATAGPVSTAGPTVERGAMDDFLDAPVENVSEFLKQAGPDADPRAVVKTLEEYDADPTRVLSPQEFAAKEAAIAKLPVGERVRRKWEGGVAFLGALKDGIAALNGEIPTRADLVMDGVSRLMGSPGNGAVDRAKFLLQNLPGTLKNAGENFGVTGLDYAADLNDVGDASLSGDGVAQLSREEYGARNQAKRDAHKYERYVLRKGVAQQRAEILSDEKLPGVQFLLGMAADPMNVVPFGAGLRGGSVTGQVVKRGTAVAGSIVEKPAGWVANTLGRAEEAVGAKAAGLGITPGVANALKYSAGAVGAGAAGIFGTGENGSNSAMVAGALLGLPAAVSLSKHVARGVQAVGAGVRRGAQEALSATGLGVKEFAKDLAEDVAIPEIYRREMIVGRPVDSPLRRAAMDTGLPEMTRRLARTVEGTRLPQVMESAGGAVGAALDAAILNAAMASGRSDEEMGGAIAAGLGFGVAGRMVNRASGMERRTMENGDVARMLAEVAADDGKYSNLLDLPHDQLAQMASVQGVFGRNVGLKPLRDGEFQAEMQRLGLEDSGRGVHIVEPGSARDGEVLVNVDKLRGQGPHVFRHEYAHALQKSNVLDGQMREGIRDWVDESFAPGELQKARVAYAAKLAGSDEPAVVAQKLAQLDRRDAEAGRMPGDWAKDEVWAETFASSGKALDMWSVRGRGPGLLRAAARGLAASGIPLDPSTGRVIVESPIFGKVKSQIKGSVMERRLNDYLRSYAQWVDGPATSLDSTTTGPMVFEQGIPKAGRFVSLAEVRPGVRENQFMREVDGRLAFKTQKEIDAEFESRRKTFESMRLGAAPVKVDGEWGKHRAPDGSVRVGGAVLPERFMMQPNVGPYLKAVEAEMRAAQEAGRSVRIVYHKIGSATPKGYRVKNLGNLRADVLEVVPFWRQITKADNVLVHVLDANQFRRNAIREINAGRLQEFGNDMVEVERDLKQYLDNHRKGLDGENGIGTRKRDALNRLLGIKTEENKGKNPLASAIGMPRPKSAVKTLRLDRVEMARPGNEGMAFDYHRANSNMMPDGEWRADAQVDLAQSLANKDFKNLNFGTLSKEKFDRINEIRAGLGADVLDGRDLVIPANVVRKLYDKRILKDGMAADDVADLVYSVFHSKKSKVLSSKYSHIQTLVNMRSELSRIGFISKNPSTGETVIKSARHGNSRSIVEEVREAAKGGPTDPSIAKPK